MYGRQPVLLPSLRQVARGTRGAVSLPGSMMGLLSAGCLVVEAIALGSVTGREGLWAMFAATISTHLESWLASRSPDLSGGPLMNAFHTTVSMLLALLLYRVWP